jgi:ketosteroid isomerase-like protein
MYFKSGAPADFFAVQLKIYDQPMFGRFVSAVLCTLILPSVLAQTTPNREQSEVKGALARFVVAFDNLDWETFRLSFSDDATVFYPRGFPERANGRAAFEKTFKVVFNQIRGNKTKPPYMDIQPRDMRIQIFGDVAIATFHLDDRAGFVNRRTIVLNKTKDGWKIVHLHASEVSLVETKHK